MTASDRSSKHTLSVLVEDNPGVLTRISALFSRRGFNIDSLAVGPTEHDEISRMTVVVDVEELETDAAQDELARRGADLMRRLAQPTDVIGLPWSRMVAKAVRHFDGLPPVPIVQLSGALDLPAYESSPVDVVRDAARLTGGEPRVFYAPLVADDAAAAAVIRAQASVAGTLDDAKHCSLALVGVGGWSSGESTLFDLASDDERDD
mgnify:CR=1 FL=1